MGTLVPILSRPPAILWVLSHRWESTSPPERRNPLHISRKRKESGGERKKEKSHRLKYSGGRYWRASARC